MQKDLKVLYYPLNLHIHKLFIGEDFTTYLLTTSSKKV